MVAFFCDYKNIVLRNNPYILKLAYGTKPIAF